MTIFTYLDRLVRRQSSPPAAFTLADDHLLDEDTGEPRFLQREQSYFEIRLKQMYLRNQREYWRDFRPFSTFVTGFSHGNRLRELPFVVGPDRLGDYATVVGGDAVEYRNLRVAGPFPYEGGDLELFAALSRLEANNWAVQTLGLLETVAKAFDVSKITRYLEIAAPLVKGIESFLGMENIEMRMGLQQVYEQPVGRGGLRPNALRARHEVLLNRPSHTIDEAEQQRFWIKEGRLFHGDQAATAQPYRETDFLLYEIRPLSERSDYRTFDFHTVNWEDTVKTIWEGSEELAWQKLRMTALALVQCRDIIRPQRNFLLHMYRQQFDEELAYYQDMMVGQPAHRSSPEIQAEVHKRVALLSDEKIMQAVKSGRTDRERSPEQVMMDLGL